MRTGNIVRFHFGAHQTHAEIVALLPDFAWCSIYCPEGTGYGDVNRDMYRMLTAGDLWPKTAFNLLPGAEGPFELAQLKMIAGSGKRIELIDVPHGIAEYTVVDGIAEEVVRTSYFDGGYRQACANAVTVQTAFVQANRNRERYIIEQLLRLNDECSGERILVRMGTTHYRMADLANVCGLTVERGFCRGKLSLPGLCYHYLNTGRTIPSRVLAMYLFRGLLMRYWAQSALWLDRGELEALLWARCRPFTESDIEEIWERVRADDNAAQHIIMDSLRSRGFKGSSA